jgi:tetratricopeptide (TPR) repeat protein
MASRSAHRFPRGSAASVASVALLILPLVLAGCHSAPVAAAAPDRPAPVGTKSKHDAASFNLKLAPPAVLTDEKIDVQPRAGDALAKAQTPYEKAILAGVAPAYLKSAPAVNQPMPVAPLTEPPAPAIKAYVLGRAAYEDNDRWQAIEHLEQAHRLDPKSAQVLRLLGQIYFAYGNEVKGAQRLTEAVQLEPGDADSLFMLGRFAFQKGQWDETIATLARSSELPQGDADPAVFYLRPYYLGQALLQQGYDAAAVAQFQKYLRLPVSFNRTTRLNRELAFLDRQRSLVSIQVGDALCRLGRLDEAADQYALAAKDDDAETAVDQELLAARQVYAMLAMNDSKSAEKTLLDWLRHANSSTRALKLLPYLAEHGGNSRKLIDSTRAVYDQADHPASLALAVAQLLPDDKASAFLLDHLKMRPSDDVVYQQLIARFAEKDRDRLVAVVVEMIRRAPKSADRYAGAVANKKADVDDLLPRIDKLPAEQKNSAAAWYLRGALYTSANRIEKAGEAFDKAFAADATFLSPQLATVRLKVKLGRFDEAAALLDQLEKAKPQNADNPEMRFARIEVLTGQGKLDDAISLLDKLLAEQPREVPYRLLKAKLQREKKDFDSAERTLWAIIDIDPASEPTYAALFDLYDDDSNPRNDYTQFVRLLKRVQREIPTSRIARLKMAEWYAANRAIDRAEELLRQLLKENPADIEATAKLASTLGLADRWADAEKLLLDQLEKRPDDGGLMRLLEEVSQKLDHMEQFFPRKEAFLNRQKPSFEIAVLKAQLYDQWSKPDQALAALEEAVKLKPERTGPLRITLAQLYLRADRLDKALEQVDLALKEQPDKAADLYYFKSSVYASKKQQDKAELALQDALKADPDHAPSNNDLGYLWAEAGKNMVDAEKMCLKAVAAEPEKGEYLDSLAWVYYKFGRFDEALRRLEEARTKPGGDDPVILEHLGDTLWRLKQNDRAADFWRAALRLAEQKKNQDRPDVVKLKESVNAKLKAVGENAAPVLSPTAAEAAPAPGDKPADKPPPTP